VMVQRVVRTREYERDGLKHRVFELRGDTILCFWAPRLSI
jgi:hypothetical protein